MHIDIVVFDHDIIPLSWNMCIHKTDDEGKPKDIQAKDSHMYMTQREAFSFDTSVIL